MNFSINIFSDIKNYKFFDQLLNNYTINYKNLSDLREEKKFSSNGIIFINENSNINLEHLKYLEKKYIVLSKNKNEKIPKLKNILLVNYPLVPQALTKHLKFFFENGTIKFKDIEIDDLKLINKKNKKSCLLTEIEKNILTTILKTDQCTKNYIKKNILKIRPDLQTNSLESHITRIRKKMDNIDLNLKIQSKNENLSVC